MRRFRRHLALSVVPTIMSELSTKDNSTDQHSKRSLRDRPMFAYHDGQMKVEEKDDEIHWRALELRKIMEHRDEEKKKRKEHDEANERSALRREMHLLHDRDATYYGRTHTHLSEGIDNFRRSFVQSDQQFRAIQSVRYLSEDSQRNTRRQREHVDKLDDLTKRLIRMRGVVQQGTGSGTVVRQRPCTSNALNAEQKYSSAFLKSMKIFAWVPRQLLRRMSQN